jgi:hypothetical protein
MAMTVETIHRSRSVQFLMNCQQCGKVEGRIQQCFVCDPGGEPVEVWLHPECEADFMKRQGNV